MKLQFALAVVDTMMGLCVLLTPIRELMEKGKVSRLTIAMLLLYVTSAILNLTKGIL